MYTISSHNFLSSKQDEQCNFKILPTCTSGYIFKQSSGWIAGHSFPDSSFPALFLLGVLDTSRYVIDLLEYSA